MSIPRPTGAPGAYFERLGVSREALDKVLAAALSQGADDCDLYFQHASSHSVGLSDGKVNKAVSRIDLGLGVRVVVGDQVGYAYTEDLSLDADALDAARTAAEIARGPAASPRAGRRWRAASSHPEFYPLVAVLGRTWSLSERVRPGARRGSRSRLATATTGCSNVQVHFAERRRQQGAHRPRRTAA